MDARTVRTGGLEEVQPPHRVLGKEVGRLRVVLLPTQSEQNTRGTVSQHNQGRLRRAEPTRKTSGERRTRTPVLWQATTTRSGDARTPSAASAGESNAPQPKQATRRAGCSARIGPEPKTPRSPAEPPAATSPPPTAARRTNTQAMYNWTASGHAGRSQRSDAMTTMQQHSPRNWDGHQGDNRKHTCSTATTSSIKWHVLQHEIAQSQKQHASKAQGTRDERTQRSRTCSDQSRCLATGDRRNSTPSCGK